jgi:hypothetical protein
VGWVFPAATSARWMSPCRVMDLLQDSGWRCQWVEAAHTLPTPWPTPTQNRIGHPTNEWLHSRVTGNLQPSASAHPFHHHRHPLLPPDQVKSAAHSLAVAASQVPLLCGSSWTRRMCAPGPAALESTRSAATMPLRWFHRWQRWRSTHVARCAWLLLLLVYVMSASYALVVTGFT